MTYELAKQLKEAGFSQGVDERICEHSFNPKDLKSHIGIKGLDVVLAENGSYCSSLHVYLPTLSELIEACGEEITSIMFWGERGCGATRRQKRKERVSELTERGKTPEEAVARLWLKLNE